MIFYYFIIVMLILFSIGRIGKVKNNTVLLFVMLCLWLLATIRSLDIGNDTKSYYELFNSIASGVNIQFWSSRYEIGYLLLNKLISRMTDNFWVFLSIVNAIIYFAYFLFFKNYSVNSIMSVFMFFTFGTWGQTVNILRLQLAIAMAIYAFICKDKKKYILMIVLLLLAFGFHRISLVFLLFLFVPQKISKKFYLVTIALTVVGISILPTLMQFVARYIPYFSAYISSSTYVFGEAKLATILSIVMRVLLLSVVWYFYLSQAKENSWLTEAEEKILSYQFNMVFVSTLFMVLSLNFNLLDRCSYYYWTFAYVLVPNVLSRIDNYGNKHILRAFILLLGVAYFLIIIIYRPEWNHIFPYSSILF